MNIIPSIAMNAIPIAPTAAERRAFLNRFRSTIGCSWRRSYQTNNAPNTIEMANPPSVTADSQPFSGASMMAYIKADREIIEMTAPTTSIVFALGSRLSGITNNDPINATATTGTFNRNTDPQKKCSSR